MNAFCDAEWQAPRCPGAVGRSTSAEEGIEVGTCWANGVGSVRQRVKEQGGTRRKPEGIQRQMGSNLAAECASSGEAMRNTRH
jgi:hypothetical protein